MSVIQVDDSNFESEVIKADGPVLVDFSATWCGPCKRLEPIIDELANDYDGRVKVVKVDVDAARGTASKFGIMSVPTVMLFHQGDVKQQAAGLRPKEAFAEMIDEVL